MALLGGLNLSILTVAALCRRVLWVKKVVGKREAWGTEWLTVFCETGSAPSDCTGWHGEVSSSAAIQCGYQGASLLYTLSDTANSYTSVRFTHECEQGSLRFESGPFAWNRGVHYLIKMRLELHRGLWKNSGDNTCTLSDAERESCVKVELDVLGSPSLIVHLVSVDVKQHLRKKKKKLSDAILAWVDQNRNNNTDASLVIWDSISEVSRGFCQWNVLYRWALCPPNNLGPGLRRRTVGIGQHTFDWTWTFLWRPASHETQQLRHKKGEEDKEDVSSLVRGF